MKAGASIISWSRSLATEISTGCGVSIRKTTLSATKRKSVLNMVLNQRNDICLNNQLYRRIRAEFPITFAAVEDIKRKDHRNLSKQLQRFMADAVAAALVKVQQKGIAAIPHVDALICRRKDHALVCEALGSQIFLTTGICANVGGIRYSPLTEIEEQALAFDEIDPADKAMSYDDWEAVRIVRCVAALKLMRRCPPFFVPVALAAWRV